MEGWIRQERILFLVGSIRSRESALTLTILFRALNIHDTRTAYLSHCSRLQSGNREATAGSCNPLVFLLRFFRQHFYHPIISNPLFVYEIYIVHQLASSRAFIVHSDIGAFIKAWIFLRLQAVSKVSLIFDT